MVMVEGPRVGLAAPEQLGVLIVGQPTDYNPCTNSAPLATLSQQLANHVSRTMHAKINSPTEYSLIGVWITKEAESQLHYSSPLSCWLVEQRRLSNVLSGITSQWLRQKGYVSHMTAYRIFNGIECIPAFTCRERGNNFGKTTLSKPDQDSYLDLYVIGHLVHCDSSPLYHVFTEEPALCLLIITQVGCESVSIIILFTITLLFNGSYFGGSMLGNMDLGVNFAGTMAGISGTITGVTGIIAPTIVGAVTNNQLRVLDVRNIPYKDTNINPTEPCRQTISIGELAANAQIYLKQTRSAWSMVFYISSAMSALPYLSYFFFGSVEEQAWNKLKVVESNSDLIKEN
ncbi:unnamed protein product [Timema podura]|uniref:Uncharacterized protein n=1 Tax=Timema podura TaxID=61482 RepID=A0ABN7NZG3_TIMPD|nr:unnamed protein product [Timema podura]